MLQCTGYLLSVYAPEQPSPTLYCPCTVLLACCRRLLRCRHFPGHPRLHKPHRPRAQRQPQRPGAAEGAGGRQHTCSLLPAARCPSQAVSLVCLHVSAGLQISWEYVECAPFITGSIKMLVKPNSNAYFQSLNFANSVVVSLELGFLPAAPAVARGGREAGRQLQAGRQAATAWLVSARTAPLAVHRLLRPTHQMCGGARHAITPSAAPCSCPLPPAACSPSQQSR